MFFSSVVSSFLNVFVLLEVYKLANRMSSTSLIKTRRDFGYLLLNLSI